MSKYYSILRLKESEVKWYAKPAMPFTKILIIEDNLEGTFLYHYSINGKPAGDTWHQSFDEAKKQATFAFGSDLGEWKEIPANVENSLSYVMGELAATRN